MQLVIKQAEYYLQYTHDDRESAGYLRIQEEVMELRKAVDDLERCMREHGIGFTREARVA